MCYFFLGEPLFTQVSELLIAIQPLRMASKMSTSREEIVIRRPEGPGGCLFHVISRLLRSHLRSGWRRCLADFLVTTSQEFFNEVFQVVCQMVSIGYLPSLRGPFACSGGIILSSVSADDINFWVRLYPNLGRFRLPIGKSKPLCTVDPLNIL